MSDVHGKSGTTDGLRPGFLVTASYFFRESLASSGDPSAAARLILAPALDTPRSTVWMSSWSFESPKEVLPRRVRRLVEPRDLHHDDTDQEAHENAASEQPEPLRALLRRESRKSIKT